MIRVVTPPEITTATVEVNGEVVIGFERRDLVGVLHELGRGNTPMAASDAAFRLHNPACPVCKAHGLDPSRLGRELQ